MCEPQQTDSTTPPDPLVAEFADTLNRLLDAHLAVLDDDQAVTDAALDAYNLLGRTGHLLNLPALPASVPSPCGPRPDTRSEHRPATEVDHGVTVEFCTYDGEFWPCEAVRTPSPKEPTDA